MGFEAGGMRMTRKKKPDEIVAKLQQFVEVLTAQGKSIGEAIRRPRAGTRWT
jgi:hypothetical protein